MRTQGTSGAPEPELDMSAELQEDMTIHTGARADIGGDHSGIRELLPREVTDYVIDFLHGDPTTLRACTLVSRAWLPSSRFHLFPRCQLGLDESKFADFLEFAKHCQLGPQFIRDISLRIKKEFPLLPSFLVDLLPYLQNLESIKIMVRRLPTDNDSRISTAIPHHDRTRDTRLFKLKKLSYTHISVTTGHDDWRFIDLAACLAVFDTIEELDIDSTDYRPIVVVSDIESRAQEVAPFLPAIETVNIYETQGDVWIHALVLAPLEHPIRALSLVRRCIWSHDRLGTLLERVGHGLRHLDFNLSQFKEPRSKLLNLRSRIYR